ncbi:MAG: hypothetical protein AB1758_14785 [Candidatus Eremiobacterota bacterium]
MTRARGLALVMVLLALALLGVVAAALVALGSRTLWESRADEERDQALLAADAGLWRTVDRLRTDPNFRGYNRQSMRSTGAEYWSSVTPGGSRAPNDVRVPDELCYVLASGEYRGRQRQVGLMVSILQTDFSDAAFAARDIDLRRRCKVESWNSNQGPYPAGRQNDANVASSWTGVRRNEPAVKLTNGSEIRGHVFIAPGVNQGDAVLVDPDSNIRGQIKRLRPNRQLSGVTAPAGTPSEPTKTISSSTVLPPGHYGEVLINSRARVELVEGGEYVFDKLTMRDDSVLEVDRNVSAPVKVYMKGEFDMQGGSVVNRSAKPANLRFLVEQGQVYLDDSQTKAYFVVYAPESQVTVDDDAQIYGAVVGKSITLRDNSELRYDLALKELNGADSIVTIVSRQEF